MSIEDLARRLLADRDPLPPAAPWTPASCAARPPWRPGSPRSPARPPSRRARAAVPARLARSAVRPPVLAAAAAVLAVALVAVVAVGLPRSGPAYAATPPLLLPLAAPEGPRRPSWSEPRRRPRRCRRSATARTPTSGWPRGTCTPASGTAG